MKSDNSKTVFHLVPKLILQTDNNGEIEQAVSNDPIGGSKEQPMPSRFKARQCTIDVA